MATLTAQQITQSGLKPVYAAAAVAGDLVANTGVQYFMLKMEVVCLLRQQ